ncbi:MAG: molybdopterin oxidoreductase [Acidobacteria bacterium]|nr:MAG: molybdopterin oxidoreductase [Acidobacteriota bacterium]PYS07890.1 MAG: molybdopterin oxidoreductase [Acidobacteriota bacterium]
MSNQIIRAVCPHDCPDTCAMLVEVDESGRAVRVRGDPEHPFTHGGLCVKVAHYEKRTYHRERLLYPMKRASHKGEGKFVRISWDEALETIAPRLKAIAQKNPQSILPYSYAGTMGLLQGGSMDRRFFHRLGASLLDRTICSTAGMFGMRYTVGASVGTNPETVDQAKYILIWGSNIITSNIHLWRYILKARSRGAKIVTIDPLRTKTGEQSDEHIPIMPGTDGALALAMMHIIIRDGLQDQDYVDRYTIGFEALKERVKEYPPSRVSEITGISEATIERITHEYATQSPAFIRVNYGLQRHAGGGMAVRNIFCLPGLIGSWRYPGGGAVLSTSGFFKYNNPGLERPDLIAGHPRTINMSQLGEALRCADPPVEAIVVYNSNPGAVAPNQQRVLDGLKREDLFTVVLEHFQTDTADYADVLLPATTQLEHLDIHRSYGHTYAMLNMPAIRPLGESKPNTEIFRLLAKRMGFDEPCFDDSDEDLIRQALTGVKGISLDELKDKGWVSLRIGDAPFAEGNFPTPSGKCEFYSERLKDLDPLPTYVPPREDRLSNPALAQKFPLVLISPPAHHFLNSTFVNLFQEKEVGPALEIHAVDAAARHIADGSPVQIFNGRGGFLARAVVTDRTRPGVVCAPSIWWNKLVPGGRNANSTTSEELTDLGGGATFYDNLVDVRLAD